MRATECARSDPKSFSSIWSVRSIPALLPAAVQIGPSTMKMRSLFSRTSGKRVFNSSVKSQCVVTRRLSRRPASASAKTPVQMEEIRRDDFAAFETKASRLGEVGTTQVLPPMM